MSFLGKIFGSSAPSAPPPLPPDTTAADEAKKQKAARDAIIARQSQGRASTIVGGTQVAYDELAKKRAAGTDLLGG